MMRTTLKSSPISWIMGPRIQTDIMTRTCNHMKTKQPSNNKRYRQRSLNSANTPGQVHFSRTSKESWRYLIKSPQLLYTTCSFQLPPFLKQTWPKSNVKNLRRYYSMKPQRLHKANPRYWSIGQRAFLKQFLEMPAASPHWWWKGEPLRRLMKRKDCSGWRKPSKEQNI